MTPYRIMRIIARLNVGGPAIHVSLLSKGLNDSQFETMLVSGKLGPHEGDMSDLTHGLNVQTIPAMQRSIHPLRDAQAVLALIRLMRSYRPHIVHTHTAKAGFVGRLAARLTGVPAVVHTFHGHVFHGYFGPLKTALFLRLERLSAKASDVILTISDRLRDELIGYRIAAADRIRVVPLGLDLTSLTDVEGLCGRLHAELGCPSEYPLVGIVGRLVPIKNHNLFLEAARLMADHHATVRFVIVGDGEERSAIEARIKALDLTDRVYLTGWRRDLPVIYAGLSALALTSRNEGTPVSIIEAMAAGVPVVATNVGGVPDLLANGSLGRMVADGDAEALAENILNVLEEAPQTQIDQARAHVLAHYDSARLLDDLRVLYTEVLAAKGYD
ncbi:MAG: glycosyltransferase family 4 protein [Chloroflexi bacterium]|nr:glycosyltransferase family 4 protein [Chloroflexota bacterium]